MGAYYDFESTRVYTYGDGVINEIKRLTLGFGRRYLIVTYCGPLTEKVIKAISESLDSPAGAFLREHDNPYGERIPLLTSMPKPDWDSIKIEYKFLDFEGLEVTLNNCKKLAEEIKEYNADVVVAVGGGKALDIVRAACTIVDLYNRPKIVLCPTMLASNAPALSFSIIYNEEGTQVDEIWYLAYPSEAVIVDTELIINAPYRTLVAGIGDQLSSSLESIHAMEMLGIRDTFDRMGVSAWEVCYNTLIKYGRVAIEAMKRKEITREFEWVVSAVSYSTGPQNACGSLLLSHKLDEALIAFEPVSRIPHGLVVGYGCLPELVFVGKREEIYNLVDFYLDIGIPCTLEQLGIPDVTHSDIVAVCREAFNRNEMRPPVAYTPEDAADAVMEADRLVREYLKKK